MSWPSIDHYNRQTWCLSMCFSKTDFLVKVFPHSSHLFKRCIKYKSRQTQIWRSTWAQDNHKVLFNIKTCNLRFSGCLGTVFQECFDSSCNEVGRGGGNQISFTFHQIVEIAMNDKKIKMCFAWSVRPTWASSTWARKSDFDLNEVLQIWQKNARARVARPTKEKWF